MKPIPRYDFPVGVWPERTEHPSPADASYEGIYSVALNHEIPIAFVPEVDRRTPWPPELPDNIDAVCSVDDARRTVVALTTYVVTPDAERAGTIEAFERDGEGHTIFYVLPEEFVRLQVDLQSVYERLTGVRSAVPISTLSDTALARFLLDRLLPSGRLANRELHMLGRGGDGPA